MIRLPRFPKALPPPHTFRQGKPVDPFLSYLADHHGVFTRAEASTFGITDNVLSGMLRRGEIVRTHPSTYRMASNPRTWHAQLRSASLSARGVASHRAAAALWGIDGFPRALVEVTIEHGRRVVIPGVKLHRSTQFALRGEVEIDGIPVTGCARTILDVAAVVGPRRLDQAVDAVLRQKLLTWPDLYDVLVRHSVQGRTGCGKLRRLLDVRFGDTAIPDSRWNRMVADLLVDAGLPAPTFEHEIRTSSGAFIGRVDLAFPGRRIAIELDSARWHLNSASFARDPRRKNKLIVEGWTVLTFTWSDYVDHPAELVATVAQALHIS